MMIAVRRPTRQQLERAIAIVVALLGIGMSAHAAIRAIAAGGSAADQILPAPVDYDDQDQFPGAAYFYAVDDDAAPAAGTTGTAALPDLPLPPGAAVAAGVSDGTVVPALPFTMAHAGSEDRSRALDCLASAVYYEAASQSDDGQRAVAQVVLNRVRHPAFPDTVCGVVYQGSERASGCQFSFACDGAMARPPAGAAWGKALEIAGAALGGYVFAPVGLATHYHTYAVTPAWNRDLIMTDAIGAHLFHRWAGYWGTLAAFDQVYRGSEPLPGPHARIAPPAMLATALASAPMIAAAIRTVDPAQTGPTAPAAPVPTTLVQPAYADSGAAKGDPADAADALPQSQILDRWKDSGKPLQ